MEIVLLQNVKKVGKPGEVKNVARGFAMNYLIPFGFALPATKGFVKEAIARTRKTVKTMKVDTSEVVSLFAKIDGLSFDVTRKASREGKLYGSVKISDIADLIEDAVGRPIDEKFIQLKEPVKSLGESTVTLMSGDVSAQITINVVGEEVKAEKGAKKAKMKAKAGAAAKSKKK